jgi:hypothetical protein
MVGRPGSRRPLQFVQGWGNWPGIVASLRHPRGFGTGCFVTVACVSGEECVEGKSPPSSSWSESCAAAGRGQCLPRVWDMQAMTSLELELPT